ncbi:MAG: preprotein translocase subunit SecG [Candidatus Omnitrophota bacterium]
MFALLIFFHVVACLVLIAVILLQAGKGGGLSEEFGGGGFQSIFGTKTSKFLTKATATCAVIFLTTSLTLALFSAKRKESLIEREMAREKNTPAAATAQKQLPVKAATGQEQPNPITEEAPKP